MHAYSYKVYIIQATKRRKINTSLCPVYIAAKNEQWWAIQAMNNKHQLRII